MSTKRTVKFLLGSFGLVAATNGFALAILAVEVRAEPELSDRLLRKEVTVAASAAEVWRAWTTPEGLKSFFGADAKVELRPGGAYEVYFDLSQPYGLRGAEGCTVLTYLPHELLAFTWNAPPSIPGLREANARTQVVIELLPSGAGRTRVRMTQHGFGEGEDWARYYAYFDRAWGHVLEQLAETIRGGDEAAPTPERTWRDGNVTVSEFTEPTKRQDFEITISAAPSEVWHVLTTPEGIRSFYPSNPVVELRIGGPWDLHGGKPNRVQAFVPGEMLAATGSAPDRFPNVKKGGHWGIFRLHPRSDGATILRLSVVGWGTGDEWDQAFDYFLKANAAFMEMIHRRFVEGPLQAGNRK